MPRALITGAAGFVGSHLVGQLLDKNWTVTGIDNFEPFYPRATKWQNLCKYLSEPRFELAELDIRNSKTMRERLTGGYDAIVHLAAKAGVRPSIDDPAGYEQTNVVGTQNLLELAQLWGTPQFVFASSSSVYGLNPNLPWSENECSLRPISPYASTKISGELLGHVYSHLYGMRFVALRLFTVYGPRQRPDLAIHKFASLIKSGNPIPIFGDGTTSRDYTYISDITEGIESAMKYSESRFEIFNLGNNKPIRLIDLVREIGIAMEIEPHLQYLPMQPGDVGKTCAQVEKAREKLSYEPKTSIKTGLKNFAEWFKSQPHNHPTRTGRPPQNQT